MSVVKVSDYIMDFLVEIGIKHLFLISGGGMMHLLDSAGKNKSLELVFNLNEQATGICAESYAQFTGNIGAAMLTTGPGATNAVTGCAGAWTDSTPVIYISGQCKTEQMGQLKGLRFYGAQEIAIVPCVKPITKYAVTVLDKQEIKYHLEKAYYLATHGRKGPVWIDVPLDIQGASVNTESLKGFDPVEENLTEKTSVNTNDIEAFYKLLNASKRPVILIGHGVVASKCQKTVRNIVDKFQIPVLSTWRAKGIFCEEDLLYMGCPGVPAPRYANYALQNSDLLLIVGTRLNAAITAYDEKSFAPNATKIIVDVDSAEIDKHSMHFALNICADAATFFDAVYNSNNLYQPTDRGDWIDYCIKIKEKYPLLKEKQQYDQENKVDGYLFAKTLSDYSTKEDVFIGSSSGRTCGISHLAYELKRNQPFVTSMGLGSMGWALPNAIASCFASGKKRTILLEGDGSMQHNLQELQLIKTYNLPIKIFVLSNGGYASIYAMQRNNFENRLTGCTPKSGLCLPEFNKIAELYGILYCHIKNNDEIAGVLNNIMSNNEPCICEIDCSINFDEIPKSVTVAHSDGTFSSSKLENLYPEVSQEEQNENMPDWSKL